MNNEWHDKWEKCLTKAVLKSLRSHHCLLRTYLPLKLSAIVMWIVLQICWFQWWSDPLGWWFECWINRYNFDFFQIQPIGDSIIILKIWNWILMHITHQFYNQQMCWYCDCGIVDKEILMQYYWNKHWYFITIPIRSKNTESNDMHHVYCTINTEGE